MAGWSSLTNGSALNCADDVVNRYKGGGRCLDTNHVVKDDIKECIVVDDSDDDDDDDDCEDRVICLFEEVVSNFYSGAADKGCIRPIPALLGDGQSLDLFKLFCLVRKRGGFDLVNGFWGFVAKELGLDLRFSASVKLIYFKYLYELEKCMRNFRDDRSRNRERRCVGSLSFSLLDLETQFRSLLSLRYDQKQKHCKFAPLGYNKNGRYIDVESGKSKIGFIDIKDVHKLCIGVGNRYSDDEENSHGENKRHQVDTDDDDDDDDVVILDPSIAKKDFNSRKRKRESLTRMLNWVIQIAKWPNDPSIGAILPQSRWKNDSGDELWVQAIRARDALLRRRPIDSSTKQSLFQVYNTNLQNGQKMHPSLFEDFSVPSDQSAERLRCSQWLPASVKPHSCSFCTSCSAPQSKSVSPLKTEFVNGLKEQGLVVDNLSSGKTTLSTSGEEHVEKHVAVGPRFQAEVPEWTGMVSESDSKWLGTRVWLSEYQEHDALVAMDPIGKGRPTVCCCQLPGSVGCVRFHITEERMQLKLRLGSLFYHWRFDRMGEEVSLRWSAEEGKRFKDMIRFNPLSAGKCFWDNAYKYFPRKTREDLVSYYFNVYLVGRRSYQNRVTPYDIDSDDDETEFGSFSDGYGHEAVIVPGANMLMCSQNMQCTDFTETGIQV